jgi:hypothetical protein
MIASTRNIAWGAALAASLVGCAADEAEIGTISDDIIGGVALRSATYNAVGALAALAPGDSVPTPFCSGTLIAPDAVLTTVKCEGADVFLIGPDLGAPLQQLAVAHTAVDPAGGGLAIAHLVAPVVGVTPLQVGLLDASRTGSRLIGIGYGVQNRAGSQGTRRGGSMTFQGSYGLVFDLLLGGFDGYRDIAAPLFFPGLDVDDPANDGIIRPLYESALLAPGEVWFGGGAGDAQACYGDEGGPIVTTAAGRTSVLAVAAWFLPETTRLPCDFGAAYAAIDASGKDFIDYDLACGTIPREGTCDGTTVVRCATPEEGGYRPLRTDCAELGLICGIDDAGELGCVDDPCDGIAADGQCEGDVAVRCARPEEGERRPLSTDCSILGMTCGLVDGEIGCVDAF